MNRIKILCLSGTAAVLLAGSLPAIAQGADVQRPHHAIYDSPNREGGPNGQTQARPAASRSATDGNYYRPHHAVYDGNRAN